MCRNIYKLKLCSIFYGKDVSIMGLTIFAGGNINPDNALRADEYSVRQKKQGNSIFAGDSYLANDPIEEKRKQARQEAWNIVSGAWQTDRDIDESVQGLRDKYKEMQELQKEAVSSIEEINGRMDGLKEQYNIDPESEEQKTLELLMKKQDVDNGVSDTSLSKDELEQLKNIDTSKLSEYQTRMLELNSMNGIHKKDLQRAEAVMKSTVSGITSIQLERLKKHPMVDANKQADDLMEAAGKEIQGMLINESKENVDEQLQEEKEKAEEAAEEKKKDEEELQEIKEQRAIEKAVIEGTKEAVEEARAAQRESNTHDIDIDEMVDITSQSVVSDEVSQSLEDIKNSMKLLEADLKGIKVDETV